MKWLLVMLFFLSSATLDAQVTFQKRIGHPQSNVAEFVYDAALDVNGNMYVIGVNQFNFNLCKIDTSGNTVWFKKLTDFIIQPTRIILSSDSNLIIAGRSGNNTGEHHSFILKVDTAGNVLWSKFIEVGSQASIAEFLFEDLSGNFVFGGWQEKPYQFPLPITYQPFIVKFRYDGSLMWFKRIGEIYNSVFFDGMSMSNNKYIMIGYAGDTMHGQNDILLVETDTSGTITRSAVFGNTSDDFGSRIIEWKGKLILVSTDDNLSSSLTNHIIELDTAWNVTANRKNFLNGGLNTYDIIDYDINNLLLAGSGPMIYLIDSTYKIVKGMNYGNSMFNRRIHKLFKLENNRVFATGTNGQTSDILVLRTDSDLDAGCNSYVTVLFDDTIPQVSYSTINLVSTDTTYSQFASDTSSDDIWFDFILCNSTTSSIELLNEADKLISVFPNATFNEVNIYPDQQLNDKPAKLIVLDMQGKTLFIQNLIFADGKHTVDLSEYAPGIYIFKIVTTKYSFNEVVHVLR